MPQAIPLVIGAVGSGFLSAGLAGATTVLGVALGTTAITAIGVGLTVAGTLAQVLLTPQPPRPKFQDGSQSVKQAVPPRVRCYGRYRLGGAYIDYVGDDGDLKVLLCHCAHEIDAVEEHWLADDIVQVDTAHGGAVTTGKYDKYRLGDESSVYVISHLGSPGQTIAFGIGDWTAEHRGRGLCATYVKYSDLKAEQQQEVFPNGPPAYRATLRGAKVFDPRDGTQAAGDEATYTWSDNAALVILDYLTRTEAGVPVGFGLDMARIDLASFALSADVSDQIVARKPADPAYPDERRWRIWGAYELTEDRKTVLSDMLDACGGRLTQGPEGRIGLTVGAGDTNGETDIEGRPAASVAVGDDQILEYDFSTGKAAIERINEVRATYISPDQDWVEVEAGIQLDQASIDRNGTESSQVKLRFVPSEGQAQRIARYTLKHGNPTWSGRIRGTLALLDAWGERWVRLQLAELEIDRIFEITSMRLDRTTMSVEMEVTSYDGWWDWNAATDEADPAPIPGDDAEEDDMPVPAGVAVSIEHRPINGQSYAAIGVISWDPPPRSVFVGQARYRPVFPEPTSAGPWQFLTAEQDTDTVKTEPLVDGQAYEGEARFLGPRRTVSGWSDPVSFTAVADPVAPSSPVGLMAQANTPAVGQVTVTAAQANDPRAASLRFYRNGSNAFTGATPLGDPFFVGPGGTRSTVDTPGAGDWHYFAISRNWSNVASAPAGGVLAEVSPPAPVITGPSDPTSSYDRRPPVSGNGAIAGAAIRLYANAIQVGTAAAAGDGTWAVTPSTDLGIGANSMTATQSVAGNESVASGSVTITVNAIDTDAWAYISAMTVRPSLARQTLIKTLVESLKSAGLWAKLDCLYLLAAHHEQASRLNARSPGSFTLVATTANSVLPSFTADRGWRGGGAGTTAGGYLAGGFNATVGTNQLQQNSAHLAVWVQQTSAGATQGTYREAGGGQALIACRNPTAVLWCMSNAAGADVPAQGGDGTGFYAWSRQGAASYRAYQDVNDLGTISRASAAPVSGAFHVLRGGSGYSDARVAAAGWGAGLGGTEITALRNALHDYLAGVGAVL
ncbi:phage tail protein [Inquilinus sp. NPDC058860]|uniref:phage tail protein n=1 Tax=Inquilinus sp. NPDC058860 TaxID=3346652 RepID=UPI0036CBE174